MIEEMGMHGNDRNMDMIEEMGMHGNDRNMDMREEMRMHGNIYEAARQRKSKQITKLMTTLEIK